MFIGAVAEELNVSISFLRKLEKAGQIPEPPRRPTGLRDYQEEDVEAIEKFLKERNRKGG